MPCESSRKQKSHFPRLPILLGTSKLLASSHLQQAVSPPRLKGLGLEHLLAQLQRLRLGFAVVTPSWVTHLRYEQFQALIQGEALRSRQRRWNKEATLGSLVSHPVLFIAKTQRVLMKEENDIGSRLNSYLGMDVGAFSFYMPLGCWGSARIRTAKCQATEGKESPGVSGPLFTEV